jgi:ribose/xylose/arabinose/galactoside ABC-type transport system permease subunit
MVEIEEGARDLSDTTKNFAKRFLRHENAVLTIVLVVLIAIMGVVTKGLTVTRANIVNVLLQSSIRGMAAIGQAFVILTASIDLSVGGIALFTAILGGSMMTLSPWINTVGHPVSPYIVLPLMLLAGAAWGAANGSLVSRIGMPPLIVTLGMWQILKALAFYICGGRDMTNHPETLDFFGTDRIAGVPVPVIIFIVVVVICYLVLQYTRFGRSVYAVGGNPESAWLSGINVKRILLIVFAISGLLSGLSGFLMLARTRSATMQTLSGLELNSIAAVAIGGVSLFGGRGNLIGVVIGILIMGVTSNAMSVMGVDPSAQGIVTGTIIVAAVGVDYIRRR